MKMNKGGRKGDGEQIKVGLMNLTTHNIHARQKRGGSTSWRKLSRSVGIIQPVQLTLESGDGRRVKSTQRQPKARKAEKVLQKVLRKKRKRCGFRPRKRAVAYM